MKTAARWVLLIHQIPPRPNYLRVKIGRRLARLGAVAIKNSVYVLPRADSAHPEFQWVLGEIVDSGGDASIVEANFVEGLSDAQIEALFQAARDADYGVLASEVKQLIKTLPRKRPIADARRVRYESEIIRVRRRIGEIAAIDFFGASGRVAVEGMLSALEKQLPRNPPASATTPTTSPASVRGRTWVTRTGVHVDRIASAWLIRRFIDPEAKFRFVNAKDYRHREGELRFDMYGAEYTHEGESCSFETLLARFDLKDAALHAIGEVVHDLDLKDERFGRAETAGVGAAVAGICWTQPGDDARLTTGATLFEALHEFYRRRPT